MPQISPPLPPSTAGTAAVKVQAADTVRRNRDEFLTGREEIAPFLTRKGAQENGYVLRKQPWASGDDRIVVRFPYEWHDKTGRRYSNYGNELWEFDADGLTRHLEASTNHVPTGGSERVILGPRRSEVR
ncbi:DUF1348 family protein [Streptomyces sp. VRA16 Mangrove soil]|uniref:DUF1348 family protein n=1 Tax=Streptomyces sp. VRA16 Mangrove soil TaxID=2817434 RepID=UPI001A9E2DB3|nr:DUF1348 family protein [Streptomyces sp. VRA16 Mangrove soil]MBO1331354.1 DUF1348 family protein [Streptomyces sp. VRA16 Mangrove soil]